MRSILLLLLILTLITSRAETLTVATPSFTPPFVMTVDNQKHFIGFSVDIMMAICQHMRVTCKITSMPFQSTFDAVIKQEVDLAIGSYTITPDRQAYVQFSVPYLQSAAALLTLTNNPLKSINDLKTKRVGAETDSVFMHYLEKKFGNDIKIIPYPNLSEMLLGLNEEQVDAVIVDKETAFFWIGNNNDMFKILGEPFPLGLGIGLMANKDNTALINRVDQALLNMQNDGTYLKIFRTYFND